MTSSFSELKRAIEFSRSRITDGTPEKYPNAELRTLTILDAEEVLKTRLRDSDLIHRLCLERNEYLRALIECEERSTRLSDHGYDHEQRVRNLEIRLKTISEIIEQSLPLDDYRFRHFAEWLNQ